MFINCKVNIDEDSLKDYLGKTAGKKISLTITDNSTSLLSVKTKGNVVYVRLQRIFLEGGIEIWNEIANFVKHKKTDYIIELR